jgi:hypothetical protein
MVDKRKAQRQNGPSNGLAPETSPNGGLPERDRAGVDLFWPEVYVDLAMRNQAAILARIPLPATRPRYRANNHVNQLQEIALSRTLRFDLLDKAFARIIFQSSNKISL